MHARMCDVLRLPLRRFEKHRHEEQLERDRDAELSAVGGSMAE
jgi:hypothetical protein